MAKDKEKLFKGIDDKAITFQRAVFIVCNLKRLIKRPKKDDKQSNASGSRKRSGADDDETERSGSSSWRKGRHKEPVRRAFTLPTMLCGTLGIVPPNKQSLPGDENQDTSDQIPSGGAVSLGGVAPTGCPAAGAGGPRIRWAPGSHTKDLAADSSFPANMISSVSSLSCLVTPIRRAHNQPSALAGCWHAHPDSATATSSSATLHQLNMGSNSNYADSFGAESAISAVDSLQRHNSSTSRRRHPPSPREQQQQQLWCPVWAQLMNELDARQGQPRDQSQYAHLVGPPSALGYTLAPRESHSSADGDRSPGATDTLGPRVLVSSGSEANEWQQQSCEMQDDNEPTDTRSASSWDQNNSDQDDRVEQSAQSWAPSATLNRQRRSSNESPQRLGDINDNSGSGGRHSSRRAEWPQPEVGAVQDVDARGANASPREANLSSQTSSGQATTTTTTSQTGSTKRKPRRSTQTDRTKSARHQLGPLDQMRMKRFSSALCLADQQQQGGAGKGSAAAINHHQVSQQRQQQPGGLLSVSSRRSGSPRQSGRNSEAAPVVQLHPPADHRQQLLLLEPQDPMVLARQRRPSASNQSAVNVDQQALFSAVECNQLERAKTILEDGKVNVNSLNGDKFTCLDIAVLMRNVEMVKLLQEHNAKESSAYLTYEGRSNQLYGLYTEAKRLVEDLSRSIPAMGGPALGASYQAPGSQTTTPSSEPPANLLTATNQSGPLMLATGSLLSSALLEEKQRQLQYWRRRLDLFMQMRYEFERLEVPNAPELLVLQVVGENSLGVKIVHSLKANSRSASSRHHHSMRDPSDLVVPSTGASPRQALGDSLAAAASRCTRGPKCSHWQLADFFEQQQQQQQVEGISQPGVQFQPDMVLGDPEASGNWLSVADKQQQALLKQQKLLVFNQLLAQQLKLLSSQQRADKLPVTESGGQLGPACQRHRARMTLAHSSSTDSESLGSKQSFADAGAVANAAAHCDLAPSGGCCPADLEPCPSIAYQLMTARGSHARPNRADRNLQPSPKELAPGQRRLARASAANSARGVIITKYKVEWSHSEQMEPVLSSMIVYNTNQYPLECQINDLANGQLYYVRVAAGNHKGFSEPRPTSPTCLSPSSWRQVEGNKRRRCDEEVFRKFTKLILLNKHILDDHCSSSSSGGGYIQAQAGLRGGSGALTSGSGGAPALGGGQNKSSLINMLLLDATMPSGSQLVREHNLATEQPQLYPAGQEAGQLQQQQQSSTSMRKNLKNFFQSNSFKFHKLNNQNKRGLYLTTVIYHSPGRQQQQLANDPTFAAGRQRAAANRGQQQPQQQPPTPSTIMSTNDKIVVTNDDRLPIIEVLNDVVSPAALMSDFYWLLKINGTQWMDIKRLRQQLQKSHSSSTLHLRIKLLGAIEQMQVALNIEDIGRLFYKPIQAHDGSIVICTCKQVANTKMVSNLSIKWTHQHKIIPRHLRKISDSMLVDQSQQQQRDWSSMSSAARRHRTESTSSGPQMGPGQQTGCNINQLLMSDQQLCGLSQVAGATAALGVAAGSGCPPSMQPSSFAGGPENFRLCDYCQYVLVQRRSTMASGSSNSSLASSGDSQWSSSWLSGGSGGGRCSCGRSSSSTTSTTATGSSLTTNMLLGAPPSTQRNSTSTGAARSGSMISSGMSAGARDSVASAGQGSRQSMQPQLLSSAQKSSTYLMLASLSLYDLLLFTMNEIIHFDRCSTVPLARGLYLGFVQLQTTVESMRLLVPRHRPNMVPCARVRDNAHVSREEWQLLKRFAAFGSTAAGSQQQPPETTPTPCEFPAAHNPSGGLLLEVRSVAGDGSPAQGQLRHRATSMSQQTRQEVVVAPAGGQQDTLSLSNEQIFVQDTQRSPIVQPPAPVPGNKINLSDSDIRLPHADDDTHKSPFIRAQAPPTSPSAARPETEPTGSGEIATFSAAVTENRDPNLRYDSISQVSLPLQSQAAAETGSCSSGSQMRTPRRGSRSPTAASRITVNSMASGLVQTPEETFVRLVGSAARRLLAELRSQLPKVSQPPPPPAPPNDTWSLAAAEDGGGTGRGQAPEQVSILQSLNDDENNRIYHVELIELSTQVTFILLIPAAENVCPVTSQEKSNILGDNNKYMLLPLQIFETIHISTYEPDLLGKYSRLSAILETDLIVAQHDHRQAFSSNELKSTKSRVSHLQEMVSIADEFWRKLRWIVDVVSFARDKSLAAQTGGIKLGTIWRYFELSPSATFDQHSISWQSAISQQCSNQPLQQQQQPPAAAIKGCSGNSRLGLEVKRTTSAKMHTSPADPAMIDPTRITSCNVPEIHLTQSSSGSSSRKWPGGEHQQPQQQWGSGVRRGRRHSGGDAPLQGPGTGITSGLGQQPEVVGGSGDGLALVELRLRDSSEDEEAIYAYHISLRDATRAAAHRKSSQQSTRPIVDEEQPASPTTHTRDKERQGRALVSGQPVGSMGHQVEAPVESQLSKSMANPSRGEPTSNSSGPGSHSSLMGPRALYLSEQPRLVCRKQFEPVDQLATITDKRDTTTKDTSQELEGKFIQSYKYEAHENAIEEASGTSSSNNNNNMDQAYNIWESISDTNIAVCGGGGVQGQEAQAEACKLLDGEIVKLEGTITSNSRAESARHNNNNNNNSITTNNNESSEKRTPNGRRLRHLKTTNPFLSDSFDLNQN